MLAAGRLCGPAQQRKCRNENGAFATWACQACAEYLRPEAISPWTWHLVFLHQLRQAGYPFEANDLSLEDLAAAGAGAAPLDRDSEDSMTKRPLSEQLLPTRIDGLQRHQDEMPNLSQEYSQKRLAVWTQELRSLKESWNGFSQDWQSSLGEMAETAQQ